MIEQKALEVAKITSQRAGKKILPLFGNVLVIGVKGSPTNIFSKADLQAEKVIHKGLENVFPEFNYLSEESEFIDNGSKYTWVIDPVDGSIPFVAGLEFWGISIGLLKEQEPIIGVINFPHKNWLTWAYKGKGAFLNGRKLRVSRENDYDKALIGFDLGHRDFRREDLLKSVSPQVESVRYMPSLACATYSQLLVAKGVYDAYIHPRPSIWDICAGAVIIQEAGGKVTDNRGEPIDWLKKKNLFIVASNGILHDSIIGALKQ